MLFVWYIVVIVCVYGNVVLVRVLYSVVMGIWYLFSNCCFVLGLMVVVNLSIIGRKFGVLLCGGVMLVLW